MIPAISNSYSDEFLKASDEALKDYIKKNARNHENFYVRTGELNSIENLDLSGSNLTCLPKNISLLKNLTRIDLSSNRFEIFPKQLLKINNLKIIILRNNYLTELPLKVLELKFLLKIEILRNPIKKIPFNFHKVIRELPYTAKWTPAENYEERKSSTTPQENESAVDFNLSEENKSEG